MIAENASVYRFSSTEEGDDRGSSAWQPPRSQADIRCVRELVDALSCPDLTLIDGGPLRAGCDPKKR